MNQSTSRPRYAGAVHLACDEFRAATTRQASHAGGAYFGNEDALRAQIDYMFLGNGGPGLPNYDDISHENNLRAVLSPHIDFHRCGSTYAHTYKAIAERSSASVFVIFGTSHERMQHRFTLCDKDFDTPLGRVKVDHEYVSMLAEHLSSSTNGFDPYVDQYNHRHEHSIEFQVVLLQYLLGGRRKFTIVPILAGSFYDCLTKRQQPAEDPQVQAFVQASCQTLQSYDPSEVVMISGGDLAHIGPQFGDDKPLQSDDLAKQEADDRELLRRTCSDGAPGMFDHIAQNRDASRICGLSPTYAMLASLPDLAGATLDYQQAIEGNGFACVSFASAAFFEQQHPPSAARQYQPDA